MKWTRALHKRLIQFSILFLFIDLCELKFAADKVACFVSLQRLSNQPDLSFPAGRRLKQTHHDSSLFIEFCSENASPPESEAGKDETWRLVSSVPQKELKCPNFTPSILSHHKTQRGSNVTSLIFSGCHRSLPRVRQRSCSCLFVCSVSKISHFDKTHGMQQLDVHLQLIYLWNQPHLRRLRHLSDLNTNVVIIQAILQKMRWNLVLK